MKTVEQLAKEFDLINSEREQLVYEYNNEYLNAIEALCKAYMQDRLESLEPVAFIDSKGHLWSSESIVNFSEPTDKPLHDISKLKDKP